MADQSTNHQITLLIGYDAMGVFLDTWWKVHNANFNDFSDWLSSMSREIWVGGSPGDIAEWGDWLDTVLLVCPQRNDVKDELRRMRAEWEAYRATDNIEPLEARREALDKLRAVDASQPWHRIGDHPMSTAEAYETMRVRLSAYWNREADDITAVQRSIGHPGTAWTSTQWDKWLVAVKSAVERARVV